LRSFEAKVGINGGDKTVDHFMYRSTSDLIDPLLFGCR
jgi:hypothetical protein